MNTITETEVDDHRSHSEILAEREQTAFDLGERVAPYFQRLLRDSRLMEVIPGGSNSIRHPEWRRLLHSEFDIKEREFITRALRGVSSKSRNQAVERKILDSGRVVHGETTAYPLQTLKDAAEFDFERQVRVRGVANLSAVLLTEVFRRDSEV